ncbi:cation diffusion facilitator family transporter [Sulfolobus tengchongensis]|uniref:Cation diffusion facilitator family transporter n=2 Tax=Sulfolobus tengchongensis TaxID=207809 RepID=A0AAX4L3Y9_9CREN
MSLSLFILIIAYHVSSSPLILSEFSHVMIDFLTVLFSIAILKTIGKNETREGKYTYGLHRLEVVVAIANIFVIIFLSVIVAYISIISLIRGVLDNSIVLIITSAIAAILTFFAKPKEKDDIGSRSVYVHILSDFLGYVIGIITGALILFIGLRELDPIGALILVLLNVSFSVPLLKESFLIFMEGSPVKIDDVQNELAKISPNIHHLHIWSICNHMRVATLHVKVPPNLTIAEADDMRNSIYKVLKEKYNISHITVQFETDAHD